MIIRCDNCSNKTFEDTEVGATKLIIETVEDVFCEDMSSKQPERIRSELWLCPECFKDEESTLEHWLPVAKECDTIEVFNVARS